MSDTIQNRNSHLHSLNETAEMQLGGLIHAIVTLDTNNAHIMNLTCNYSTCAYIKGIVVESQELDKTMQDRSELEMYLKTILALESLT